MQQFSTDTFGAPKRHAWVLVGAAAFSMYLIASGIVVAAGCSIETDGETVYARVQAILNKNFFKADEIIFAPYGDINVELLPGCVFKLDGKFQVKTQRAGQLKWKRFDAEFTRKDGAPMGFKKLKFRASGG